MPKASGAKTGLARKLPLVLAAVVVALIAVVFWVWSTRTEPVDQADQTLEQTDKSYSTTVLRLNGQTVTLDIADTSSKRSLGLGKRTGLAADRGMVFVYGSGETRCFWMKDMNFPIDIIWLDKDRRIRHIERSVAPESYPQTYCPEVPAQYVVELQAGLADKTGLKTGDTLPFQL